MSPRVWVVSSQVFPLEEISINSALNNRAYYLISGGSITSLEVEELAAGQDHGFRDKAVGKCCWEVRGSRWMAL